MSTPAKVLSLCEVPTQPDLRTALRADSLVEITGAWHLAVCDLKNSTEACRKGLYREVNAVAVAFITALKNLIDKDECAFLFGGDGALVLVPSEFKQAAEQTIAEVAHMAKASFYLDLRVGLVSLEALQKQGVSLLLGRYRSSAVLRPFVFGGGAAGLAERMLKQGELPLPNQSSAGRQVSAKFDGLECRWERIPSGKAETVSWIFKSFAPTKLEEFEDFARVVDLVGEVYGDRQEYHPLAEQNLNLTQNGKLLNPEFRIRSFHLPSIFRSAYFWFLRLQCFLGNLLMRNRIKAGGVDWGNYKSDLLANSDMCKVDDALCMVVAGSAAQREDLLNRLSGAFAKDQVLWGTCVSDAAFVTCLINSYERKHIHFVDGANGGYAEAAADLKQKLRELGLK